MSMTLDVYFLKLFLAAVGAKKLVFDEVFYLITHEMFVLSLLLKFYFLLGHLIFVCFCFATRVKICETLWLELA